MVRNRPPIAGFAALAVASALLGAPVANASGICDYYKRELPSLYKLACGGGTSTSKPAGANSTFSAAFNISSASLPAEPTSYGGETIVSVLRDGNGSVSPNFAIIKGFRKFGAGISTAGNNTFYGNDIRQRLSGAPELESFRPREEPLGHLTHLNLGTSVNLYAPSKGPAVKLGLSARYNNITNTFGGGPALIVATQHFTVGGGFTREKVSNTLPTMTLINYLASARLWVFELEYNLLTSPGQPDLSPVQILTLTGSIGRLTLTAALRRLDYIHAGYVTQPHYAAQFLFSKHVSAGLLFNYVPGANSVGMQYFL
jgi:hypothetical protein